MHVLKTHVSTYWKCVVTTTQLDVIVIEVITTAILRLSKTVHSLNFHTLCGKGEPPCTPCWVPPTTLI